MKIQVKQFAKKKIEALVKKDMQEWPPGCAGWMYQPKRPYVPEKHLQEKRKYTTIYYDIVKDSGDRSYYKLTKVTGKYYCNNSATKITSQTLRIGQTGWTSNGYREQTKDFDIPASQKDWTKYPDSSWAGVLVDATNRVGCYYVVNIAAKTGKTWYVEISNNIR